MKKASLLSLSVTALLLSACIGNQTSKENESSSSKGTDSSTNTNTNDTTTTTNDDDSSSSQEEPLVVKETILNGENGGIEDSKYADEEKTSTSAKMADGSFLSITYVRAMKSNNPGGSYCQLKKNGGYLFTTEGIKGLKSVTVTYTLGGSNANKPSIFFSSTSAFSSTKAELKNKESHLPKEGETFFKIQAGGNALYIDSIKIEYLAKGGEGGGGKPSLVWDEDYSDLNYTKNVIANEKTRIEDIEIGTPTSGDQPVLVIPVEFTDKKFKDSDLADIRTVTGGTPEETKYWESLRTFYEKSSYGKLKLIFTYMDPVNMGMTAQKFFEENTKTEDEMDYTKGASLALKKGVEQYKLLHGNSSTSSFDMDKDGYIDSVIMIYSENECPSYDENGDLFWAFRYWDYWEGGKAPNIPSPSTSSPVGYSFFWASVNFFYEGTGTRDSHTGVDGHTLIHEFGHMLGADDYYNTAPKDKKEKNNPSGSKLMMAGNVLDHDIFTKLEYNWIRPTLVNGSCEVTIKSSATEGDAILLADPNGWNGTAFDEYVIMELFTPTNLNELDSLTAYKGRLEMGDTGYKTPGIRMWHVDNRLANTNDQGEATSFISDADVKKGNFQSAPIRAVSNSAYYDASAIQGKKFDALTLISKSGTSWANGAYSSEKDLFVAGDSFSLVDDAIAGKFKKYFADKNHLNNGNELPYKVTIESCSAKEAKIKFTALKS